jgi:hypothetical protein
MPTVNLDRLFDLEIDTVRRWLAAGEITDYKARDELGEIWVQLPTEDGKPGSWELYWSWRQYLDTHHPTEADLF